MGTRDMSVGLDIALKDKDKKWADAQRDMVFAKVDAARGTVKGVGAVLFLGLVFTGGAVVYSARRR